MDSFLHAAPDADYSEQRVHHVPVRTEHHVSGGEYRRTAAPERLASHVVWRFTRQVGWGHAHHRSGQHERLDQTRYARPSDEQPVETDDDVQASRLRSYRIQVGTRRSQDLYATDQQ